ncbi:MAG TPA: tetratricopeptide repeat protein [Thermoanaerobaculia bacterium]|nr:tetratricopeptide repeat protein [Thermoanaerobaculia bacterium]
MPLTVVQDRPTTIRRSRATRWRIGVLIAVHLVFAAHIAHWLIAGNTVTPVEPSEGMALGRDGIVNAGLVFFAAAALATAVFGRWFCGWGCHLVALQDLCRSLLQKAGIRPQPLRSRYLAWVPAGAFFYMFLWPAVWRLWHGDSFPRVETEWTTPHFWATFPGWVIGVLTFLVCGFAAVYFLGAKGFCTYACPYGALFGAVDRVAPMRIRVTDACEGCGHCTAVCTSNVLVHQEVHDYGMVVDPGCMKCGDCVSVCPKDALYYGAGPIALFAKPRVPDPEPRRFPLAGWEEAVLAVAFVAAFFTFRGLYGLVPFLMSLGLAGVLAYLVLVAARLAVQPNGTLRRMALKRGGRLLPAGRWFLAALAAVVLFWGHSAFVHAHAALGERDFRAADGLRTAFLDPTAETATMTAAERERLLASRRHLEVAERWGLAPGRWQALRLAWLSMIFGDGGELERYAGLALARGEMPAEVHQLMARDAWRRGDVAAAATAYERAIAAAPDEAAPYLGMGVLAARAGDLAAARAAFDRGLARLPESADLAYNAGLVRAMEGDLNGAIAGFERALVLAPGHVAARENLDAVRAAAAAGAAPSPP